MELTFTGKINAVLYIFQLGFSKKQNFMIDGGFTFNLKPYEYCTVFFLPYFAYSFNFGEFSLLGAQQ